MSLKNTRTLQTATLPRTLPILQMSRVMARAPATLQTTILPLACFAVTTEIIIIGTLLNEL